MYFTVPSPIRQYFRQNYVDGPTDSNKDCQTCNKIEDCINQVDIIHKAIVGFDICDMFLPFFMQNLGVNILFIYFIIFVLSLEHTFDFETPPPPIFISF